MTSEVNKKKKPRTPLDTIADALKHGANYASYDKEIDRLLGTELNDRDLEAEEAFELNNRRENAID
jgi:hypothetical protein